MLTARHKPDGGIEQHVYIYRLDTTGYEHSSGTVHSLVWTLDELTMNSRLSFHCMVGVGV